MKTGHVSKGGSAPYEPPCVEVVVVQVEKGFAATSPPPPTGGSGPNWGHEDGEWE